MRTQLLYHNFFNNINVANYELWIHVKVISNHLQFVILELWKKLWRKNYDLKITLRKEKKNNSRIILLYMNEINCNYCISFYVENLQR